MDLCIAIFRSRTQVYEFIDFMTNAGIACSAINTPTEAHIGCGISARFYCGHRGYAREIIMRRNLNTFVGFYHIMQQGMRTQIVKM